MNGMPQETVETQPWSNRELMLRIYYQTVETNGTVRQHHRDLYGDPTCGHVGLVKQAEANTESRVRLLSQWRVIAIIGSAVVAAIFTLLGLLLSAHM